MPVPLRARAALAALLCGRAAAGAAAEATAPEAGLPAALAADDECRAAGGEAGCGLSALQLRARGPEASEQPGAGESAALPQTSAAQNWSYPWDTCKYAGCVHRDATASCQCTPSCREKGTCCSDFEAECAGANWHGEWGSHGRLVTLYHQTSHEIGHLILNGGFKPGRTGWCGGAIYFATCPRGTMTKVVGVDSHQGFMIEAVVSLGRVKKMGPSCDQHMTGEKLKAEGYDSIMFNPYDGDEHVIYDGSQVVSKRRFPWP